MKRTRTLFILLLASMMLLNTPVFVLKGTKAKSPTYIPPFEIKLLNGTISNIGSFQGKPIVLEWAASWCLSCEDTQRAMKAIYPLYKNSANFISVSYGGSGDTLKDIKDMKNRGGYQWEFVKDDTNYAATVPIGPGSLWILDSSLKIVKDWRGVILTSNDIQNGLNSLLDADKQQPLINPNANTPGTFRADNPLFILFFGLVIGLVLTIVVVKIKEHNISVNVEQELSKSDKKLSNELSSLKSIVTEENKTSNSSSILSRNRPNKRRGKRR